MPSEGTSDQQPVSSGTSDSVSGPSVSSAPASAPAPAPASDIGGRRRRSSGSRKNSWLAHVKATMKIHRDKSFKRVLQIAKKTYKKSQSQSQSQSRSQSAGKRKVKRGGNSMKQSVDALLQKQQGGSGMAGKAPFGENAAPVA